MAQGQGLLALLRGQVGVARAHGQAVGLAADLDRYDLDRHSEVADHGAHDRQLLGVLATEQRPPRAGEMHESQHHLQHAGEMGGSGGPLQDGGDRAGIDPHGRVAVGIHDLGRGREDDEPSDDECVLAIGSAQDGDQALDIGLQGARIGLQVLPGGELERVDEDGDDDGAPRSDQAGGLGHEVEVALVESPHRHCDGAGSARAIVNGEGGGEVIAAAGQGHPTRARTGRGWSGGSGTRHDPTLDDRRHGGGRPPLGAGARGGGSARNLRRAGSRECGAQSCRSVHSARETGTAPT